jgi:hypothetical protein
LQLLAGKVFSLQVFSLVIFNVLLKFENVNSLISRTFPPTIFKPLQRLQPFTKRNKNCKSKLHFSLENLMDAATEKTATIYE